MSFGRDIINYDIIVDGFTAVNKIQIFKPERKKKMKKFKKIISLMLAAAMSFSLVISQAAAVSAASADNDKVSAARVWNGKADTSWFTKDKTKDRYEISTPEQLAGFAQLVTDAAHSDRFRGVMISLTNDIVLNDTSNWENWRENPPKNTWDPIGKVGSPINGYCPFAGVFNGNGHTISGMFVNERNDNHKEGGLFCYLSGAAVVNLKIENSVVMSEVCTSGALAGLCEKSYIDGVEVKNTKVYSTYSNYREGAPVGGIIGSMTRVNMTEMLAAGTLMAFGIVVNPLIFGQDEYIRASYVINCKAENVDLYTESWVANAGSIVGQTFRGGIYNCLSINCTASSLGNYRRDWAHFGSILGSEEYQGECTLQNCYSYNFKMIDNDKEKSKKLVRSDKERVKAVSKETLQSSNLAKKLGDGFKTVKNSSPVLANINRYKVKVVLNGSKAKFAWTSVKNAKEYKIYYKSEGKYKELTTVKGTSAELNNIKKGSTYSLLIRAIFSDGTYEEVNGGRFTLKA